MQAYCSSLLSLVVLFAINSIHAFEHDGNIVILNDKNYEQAKQEFGSILVLHYSDTCEHSRMLAPEYARVANHFAQYPDIAIGKVHGPDNPEIEHSLNVDNHPVMFLHRSGAFLNMYSGYRVAEHIISWVEKNAHDPVLKLTSAEEVEDFRKRYPLSVLGVDTAGTTTTWDLFQTISEQESTIMFGVTTDSVLMRKFGGEDAATISLSKRDEDTVLSYDGDVTKADLISWLRTSSRALVATLTRANGNMLFKNPAIRNTLFYFDGGEEDAEVFAAMKPQLEEIAKEFLTQTEIVHTFGDFATRLLARFEVESEQLPAVVLVDRMQDLILVFPLKAEVTPSNIRTHIQSFLEGKLKPEMRSAPIPETNPGPVYEVVAETFQHWIMDNNYDVLTLFYSGHHDNEDVFEELNKVGAKYADSPTVRITRMELTTNSLPHPVKLQRIPSVAFFPANYKHMALVSTSPTNFDAMTTLIWENYVLESPPSLNLAVGEGDVATGSTHDEL